MVERTTVVFGLALAAACSKSSPPPGIEAPVAQLIPDEADLAFGGKLQAVLDSPLQPMIKAAAVASEEASAFVHAASACNFDSSTLALTLAGDLDGNDDAFLMFAEARGIGRPKFLECMERAYAKAFGEKPGVGFRTRGPVRIAPARDLSGVVVLLNDDALALVGTPLVEPFFARVESADRRARQTPLAKAIARVDTEADLWLAVAFDEASRTAIAVEDPELAAMTELTVRADLERSVKVRVELHFFETGKAEAFKDALPDMIELAGQELDAMGVSVSKSLDSTSVTVDANTLAVDADIPFEELAVLLTLLMAE